MVRLEEVIGKALPDCGLKVVPHIDSRIKTLVTKFRAIVQMLSTFGFKWDVEKQSTSVERTVYNEYVKVHSNCKNLYGHCFPHLDAMMEIYGKDYPTGKPAEGFVDAVDNMKKAAHVQVMLDSSDDKDANGTQMMEFVHASKKVKRGKSSKRKRGKKEGDSAGSSELASLQASMKDMNIRLSTMASVMSRADEHERQVAEKSEKMLDELLTLEGVTPKQAMEVAQILAASVQMR